MAPNQAMHHIYKPAKLTCYANQLTDFHFMGASVVRGLICMTMQYFRKVLESAKL